MEEYKKLDFLIVGKEGKWKDFLLYQKSTGKTWVDARVMFKAFGFYYSYWFASASIIAEGKPWIPVEEAASMIPKNKYLSKEQFLAEVKSMIERIESDTEKWVLEYSNIHDSRGVFPFHVTTKTDSSRRGSGKMNYQVISEGTSLAMFLEMERLVNERESKQNTKKSAPPKDHSFNFQKNYTDWSKGTKRSSIQDVESFPDIYCVYFLFLDEEVVYVGKTTWLKDRIKNHIRSEKVFNLVSWVRVEAYQLDWVESKYIERIKPKYNKHIPSKRTLLRIRERCLAVSKGRSKTHRYAPKKTNNDIENSVL